MELSKLAPAASLSGWEEKDGRLRLGDLDKTIAAAWCPAHPRVKSQGEVMERMASMRCVKGEG